MESSGLLLYSLSSFFSGESGMKEADISFLTRPALDVYIFGPLGGTVIDVILHPLDTVFRSTEEVRDFLLVFL